MPVVRCPSCNRALNLPEFTEISTAQCPLCGTAFAVPSRVAPSSPVPPSFPQPGAREVDAHSPPQHYHDHAEDDHASRTDREAVYSACAWMRTAGSLGLLHLFFCSCMTFALFDNEIGFIIFCGADVLQFITSLVVYNGATSLQRRTSQGWVTVAGVLALVVGVTCMLLAIPVMFKGMLDLQTPRRDHEGAILLLGMGVVNLIVMVAFIGAGLKALAAVSRPGVARGFTR